MIRAQVNDVWLSANSVLPVKPHHLQVVDCEGARQAALVVTLQHLLFEEVTSATLTARVQGTTDGANWVLLDALPTPYTITVSVSAPGPAAGGTKSWTLPVSGWRWLRAKYTFTAMSVESNVTAFLTADLRLD
jgi:hypothetical protein